MKKTCKLLVILSLLLNPVWASSAEDDQLQQNFPDLLDDEFYEIQDDEFIDDSGNFVVADPLEPVNRIFFEFNDILYEWIIMPVTEGYMVVAPRDLRDSFGNFFYNLAAPIRFINSLLQGEFKQSGIVLERFVINSTLGVFGLADIAYLEFDIPAQQADFGQTIGKWGGGPGIYICWPLVGPSNLRDSVGLGVDAVIHPIPYFHNDTLLDVGYYVSNRINTLSLNPTAYEDLKRYSLDPYVSTRQAYSEYRQNFINRNSQD